MEPDRWYDGDIGRAVTKRADRMARIAYEPSHANHDETGARGGRGRTVSRWVFCERAGDGEGLFSTPLRLVLDSWLDPGAAIGLHAHVDDEEFYYLLEGRLTVTTVAPDGCEETAELEPGDAHAVRLGQSHFSVAGPEGARIFSVSVEAGGAR